MDANELITLGTEFREQTKPEDALCCYGQAFIADPNSASAFNNYGNTLRELGRPDRAVPFLQHAAILDPSMVTARFNLSVCYLLMGDYEKGWPAYENRWQFEHLAGTLPNYEQPRWTGQDLQGKSFMVIGEQGHGDIIQFSRFVCDLLTKGATVNLRVTDGLVPLLGGTSADNFTVTTYADPLPQFDYWAPLMSLPQTLGVRINNIPQTIQYINAPGDLAQQWAQKMGPKRRLRIGFCWSGRKDAWLNRHKSVPFDVIHQMVLSNPDYEWINLQIDAEPEEAAALAAAGVTLYPNSIRDWADTAALVHNLDLVIGVDTAISHLAGALGRPTWIMLNQYAQDWRWLLGRDDSPWYPTVKLFRQPTRGDWHSVVKKISKYLTWFKA